jgi:hypothetical protein
MDIQWFSNTSAGVVSIYETNITLNTVASDHFKGAYTTLIGIDKSNSVLLIKALNKEEALLPKYSESDLHPISIKQSYARINGKGIVKNIARHVSLDFSKKSLFKFNCEWEPSQKFLKVFLKEEVN